MNISLEVPPSNLFAENATIGSVGIDDSKLDDIAEIVRADDFYSQANAKIYRAMTKLRGDGQPIDMLAVADVLEKKGHLEECGGMPYLAEVMDSVPNGVHAKHYAGMVAEKSERRAIIHISNEAIEEARNESIEPADVLANAESRLHKLLERGTTSESMDLGSVLVETVDGIEKGKQPGVMTGLCDFDRLTNGLRAGSLSILAARPSVGKTALAGSITLNVAEHRDTILFFSLEQSRTELCERFLSAKTGIPAVRFRSGKLDKYELDQIVESANKLNSLPIYIDDNASRTVQQIAAVARLRKRRDNLQLIVVDYLQLITASDKKAPREQQVSEISSSLKRLARQLEVPVLCLAQLNRSIEARQNKRPLLSDLRESGAIEQDADLVCFLDRPSSYDPNADPTEAKLIVAKHRNGMTGNVMLNWHAETMTFRSAAQFL